MNIDLVNFREVSFGNRKIFFDKKHDFHKYLNHCYKTRTFPFYTNVLTFIAQNPDVNIYFTLDEDIKPFCKIKEGYVVHMDSYITFCRAISSSTKGRIHAFLSHTLNLKDISASQSDKDEYIRANATQQNIIAAIGGLPPDVQKNILDSLQHLQNTPVPAVQQGHEVTASEFLNAFSLFLTDKEVQAAFIQNIPKVQIQILRSHIEFLKTNLGQNETFIQNWIDEEDGKYRKQRCLIFGIEYIAPKREGRLSGKRFDIALGIFIHYASRDASSHKPAQRTTASRYVNTALSCLVALG